MAGSDNRNRTGLARHVVEVRRAAAERGGGIGTTSARRLVALVALVALAGLSGAAEPASASTQTFVNPAPMLIPAPGGPSGDDQGPGSLYPSSVVVQGMTGPITDVNITLYRVTHPSPEDIDILLVSPSGDHVMVMRGVCGGPGAPDVVDFTWIFDQQVLSSMPAGGPCDGFAYRPSSDGQQIWPAPGPAGPHGVSFDDFNGEQANGAWELYVYDHGSGYTGDMEGGWSLTVTTGPVDTAIPATGTFGPAGPYPAVRTISGETGVITDVNVSIDRVWHQRPDNLDLLLVGPHGEKVVLMSDACGTREAAGRGWEWDDEAPAPMTVGDDFSTCGNRSHRPTDSEPGDIWPAPAPPPPYAGTLSAFDLTDPNGDWRLFVNDDASDKVGFITNRFAVALATRPKARVAFTESAVEVREGATRTLTLRRAGPAALGAGAVRVTSVPASATSGTDFTPISTVVQFGAGEREKTVRVNVLTDSDQEPAEVFAVTIGSPTGDAATGTPSSVSVTIPASTTPGPPPPPPGLPPPPPPPGSGEDRTAPSLSRLSLTHPRFRAGGRPRGGPRGTGIRFTLSEVAVVNVAVQRAVTGRRVHGTCRASRPSNRRAARCTLWLRAGSFRIAGREGANAKTFSGKLGRRTLGPGGYWLGLVAIDAAKNRSPEKRIRFTVLR